MSTYLGQNFLSDSSILKRIVSTIESFSQSTDIDNIVEVGPGRGALTKKIVSLGKQLICIEKDTTMQDYLTPLCEQRPNMSVQYEDVLGIVNNELGILSKNSLVVGNLPYYITSPILRKFFATLTPEYAGGVFLIQKEVAEKVVHDAPKKSFLRRLINYAYDVHYCFSVPAKAFNPPPKVTSAVIRLIPKKTEHIPGVDYEQMFLFLDAYSQFKRKTLAASTKILLKQTQKQSFTIPDTLSSKRLEELEWEDMRSIINHSN